MIGMLNFFFMIVCSFLFSFFYIKSVQPARLEERIGKRAYNRCKTYRMIAVAFEGGVVAAYVVSFFFPLLMPFPRYFPWPHLISVGIATVVGVPSIWIMLLGIRDAGQEALSPKKEHKMYGGIYENVRHPQALGEVFTWWVIAFLLHSPFLFFYSFIWFPLFCLFCIEEEKDLVLRYGQAYQEYQKHVGMFFPKR